MTIVNTPNQTAQHADIISKETDTVPMYLELIIYYSCGYLQSCKVTKLKCWKPDFTEIIIFVAASLVCPFTVYYMYYSSVTSLKVYIYTFWL